MEHLGVPYGGSLILKTLLENPDLLKPPEISEDKKDKDGNPTYDASAAFLGQNIWDKTIPFDEDFKFEYMDLDEFLQENGMAESSSFDLINDSLNAVTNDASPSSPVALSQCLITPDSPQQQANSPQPITLRTPPMSPAKSDFEYHQPSPQPVSPARSLSSDGEYHIPAHEIALATVPGQEFDPRSRNFSAEELKPQPMIRKSKKIYVPEDLKDDKYWSRRKKNNVAAKRSRDARRIKENQIVLRAQFLEKENGSLKSQLDKFRKENAALKARLAKYEG